MDKHGEKRTWRSAGLITAGIVVIGVAIASLKIYVSNRKDEKKGEQTRKTANLKHQNKMTEIDRKADRQEDLVHLRHKLRQQRTEAGVKVKMDNAEDVAVLTPTDFSGINYESEANLEKSMRLVYPYFHRGEDIGLVGSTNSGKSTFVFQIAVDIARGYSETFAEPNCVKCRPMPVLLFALEHNRDVIATRYSCGKVFPENLNIYTRSRELKPSSMLKTIRTKAEEANEDGIMVIIDNYTKLSEMNKRDVDNFVNQLELLRYEFQDTKPISVLKVFHANKKHREHKSLEVCDVYGNSSLINFTQEFVVLEHCCRGCEYRILKQRKSKYMLTKDTVAVIKYAENVSYPQFVYVEESDEMDELPDKKTKRDKRDGDEDDEDDEDDDFFADMTITRPICNMPRSRGRPEKYSDEVIIQCFELFQSKRYNWDEITSLCGPTRKCIKNRMKEIRARQANEYDVAG
jgi:hypothetical protein